MTVLYWVMRQYGSSDSPWEENIAYSRYEDAEDFIILSVSDPRNYNYRYKIEKIYG